MRRIRGQVLQQQGQVIRDGCRNSGSRPRESMTPRLAARESCRWPRANHRTSRRGGQAAVPRVGRVVERGRWVPPVTPLLRVLGLS
jgi:hypothetical protein